MPPCVMPRFEELPMALRIFSAAAFAAAMLATPALASDIHYTVQTVKPVNAQTVIAGRVLWRCAGTTCVAAKNGRRDATVCSRLQREVGDIASFTAGDETFDDAALAKCNKA